MNDSRVAEPTFFSAVRQYPLLFMMVVASVAVLAFLGSAVALDEWSAESSILIEDPALSRIFDRTRLTEPERYLAAQAAILASSEMAGSVIDVVGDEYSLPLKDVLGSVEITAGERTDLLLVTFVSADPDMSIAYANAYVQAYRTYREIATASSYDSAIAVLDESIDAINGELAEINTDIETLAGLPRATELEQQLETEINDFLSTVPDAESASQLGTLLDQLQTLQIIRSLESQDPSLGVFIDRRRELNDRIAELVSRRDELQVNAALTSNGIVATSEATEAAKTIGASTVVAAGALLGGLGGIVLTFGLSVRNRRFLHKGEPELLLDMYLLAEVPRLSSFRKRDLLPVLNQPESRAAEPFRFAAGAIDARIGNPELAARHSIAVTSAQWGDGKTVFTANAGLAAATSGRRVLLVDTDFDNAVLSRMLIGASSNHKAITNVIPDSLGMSYALFQVKAGKHHRVDVLTPGTLDISPIDFFNSSATKEFFTALKDMYDLILFDTPPLLEVSYATNLVAFADGVVAVIPHRGRVVIQQELRDRLDLIGVDTVGYIYNRRPSGARDLPPPESMSGMGEGLGVAADGPISDVGASVAADHNSAVQGLLDRPS